MKSWLICLLCSLIGFLLIEHIFTMKPSVTSANGNPGLLIIILLAPLFIASLILTMRVSNSFFGRLEHLLLYFIALCFFVACTIVLFNFILDYKEQLVVALGGDPAVPESRIYRFGWFNQYTNSIYFNVYTFAFIHIIAAIIGLLFARRITT